MILETDGLSFAYGKDTVLENVSFGIPEGKNTVILGVNGEGKTTLLKCLCGILKPTGGRILFNGTDITKTKQSERARLTAYVPQTPVFPEISVFDTVLSGRRASYAFIPSASDRERAAEAIKTMGLEKLSSKSANRLSGGEKRKVAVARALCSDAPIMLMDEPAANLDLGSAVKFTETVKEIASVHGITFAITMHDISLSLRFADRLVLLKDKTVCDCGGKEILTPDNLKKIYGIDAELHEISGIPAVIAK